ncbi:MAG TPA: hypothetical protein VK421_15315 [Pyrinomonadaceae bacterium]|nr:hypothetical protein [Pyrinomonadaceae bacterium]
MTSEATQIQDEPQPQQHDGPVAPPPPSAADEPAEVLRLQPRLAPRADGLYYVHEILAYHDEAFVEAAYASVLRRAPTPEEFQQTIGDLRGGAREKIDILRDLARSSEGRSLSAFERIAGLRQSRLAEMARSLPVVGHLWQILAAVVRLPTALRHQRQFEAYALAQQQIIADHINVRRLGDSVAAELRLAIDDASAAVSMLSDSLAEISARHGERQSRLAQRIEHTAAQLEQATRRTEEAERRLAGHDARLDDHAGWFAEFSRGLEEHGRQLEDQGRQLGAHAAQLAGHGRRLDAQQEFLIREQQAIVEAQKAALAAAEEDLRETASEQRRETDALAARVDELRAAIDAAREAVGGKV